MKPMKNNRVYGKSIRKTDDIHYSCSGYMEDEKIPPRIVF